MWGWGPDSRTGSVPSAGTFVPSVAMLAWLCPVSVAQVADLRFFVPKLANCLEESQWETVWCIRVVNLRW